MTYTFFLHKIRKSNCNFKDFGSKRQFLNISVLKKRYVTNNKWQIINDKQWQITNNNILLVFAFGGDGTSDKN